MWLQTTGDPSGQSSGTTCWRRSGRGWWEIRTASSSRPWATLNSDPTQKLNQPRTELPFRSTSLSLHQVDREDNSSLKTGLVARLLSHVFGGRTKCNGQLTFKELNTERLLCLYSNLQASHLFPLALNIDQLFSVLLKLREIGRRQRRSRGLERVRPANGRKWKQVLSKVPVIKLNLDFF